MFSTLTLPIVLFVTVWLIVCSICDWRKQEVPVFLTTVPLLIAVVWSALYGNYLASLLAVVMFFVTDLNTWPAIGLTILSLAFFAIIVYFIHQFTIDTVFPLFLIASYLMLFYFGKTGGSDAKITVTLILLFGWQAFVFAMIPGGLVGLVGLIAGKKNWKLPFVIPITAGMMIFFAVCLL
jgi:prepilin signal peptidase PulO-like enzyme (type II secretory pathway)